MALMADFQQFYQLDIGDLWRGTLSVRRALILVEHLRDIVDSRYRALKLGDALFLGWGTDQAIAADTHDSILVIAAGLAGQKLTRDDLWPRPQRPEGEVEEVGTIAEFNVSDFMRMIAGG